MRTVLIVSPHFPPTSTVDLHRIRLSLPYFAQFHWRPVVLAVDPAYVDRLVDQLLLQTIPPDMATHRVRALPARWTRKVGVSDLGLRALPFLYQGGAKLIKKYDVDLVYFSTTVFTTMILGRLWKKRFRVPYILDMQDPWVGHYYEDKPRSERPPKYWLARRLHGLLEPWTMRKVDGIIAVSEAYHETLRRRYPWIPASLCRTITFGAANCDFDIAAKVNGETNHLRKEDGIVVGIYAGVLGRPKARVCAAICIAFREGLKRYPELFSRVRLKFVGTDYAAKSMSAATIQPIAMDMGLGQFIEEMPARVPYFTVLRLLKDANFLLILGSDDPQYTASKLYPYILAKKPLLAVFHESSSVVDVLRETQAGELVTFSGDSDAKDIAGSLLPSWLKLLQRLPYEPATNWQAFEPYTARELTRRQCELFDLVYTERRAKRTTVGQDVMQ